ncbi:MAG TPA: cytochrome c [Terriglobales bacterium]|nr:cytochrome c [Terriglobales bacterium]
MKTLFAVLLTLTFVSAAFAQEPPASFEKNCITCHGVDGKANTTAGKKMNIPDLASAAVQKLSDEQMFDTIANGIAHKQYPHAFSKKGVSGLEIREIIKYIRWLKTAK